MFALVVLALAAFGYIACNIGASQKRGHESYGIMPALWVALVVVLGYMAWPLVGPIVTTLFRLFGAHF